MNELLSTADVAARFHVGIKAVAKWCRAGLFPHAFQVNVRTGKGLAWLIPESDLEGFTPPKTGYPKGKPRQYKEEAA